MGKYLLLMYGKEMRMPKNVTKAQMEAGVRPWREYLGPLTKRKKLISSAPVSWRGKMLTARGTKNYSPRSIDLGGYMLIEAKSMAEAIKIAKRSPHHKMRAGVTTIRECMQVM